MSDEEELNAAAAAASFEDGVAGLPEEDVEPEEEIEVPEGLQEEQVRTGLAMQRLMDTAANGQALRLNVLDTRRVATWIVNTAEQVRQQQLMLTGLNAENQALRSEVERATSGGGSGLVIARAGVPKDIK